MTDRPSEQPPDSRPQSGARVPSDTELLSTLFDLGREVTSVLDLEDLGAVYLGWSRLRNFARAGRLSGDHHALARADNMFSWDPAPWCPKIF